ncbi:hypothetical protein [Streptomyces sp. NPDC002156]
MSTVDTHADTSPGEPLAPTTTKRRAPGPPEAARSVVRVLTLPGAMS